MHRKTVTLGDMGLPFASTETVTGLWPQLLNSPPPSIVQLLLSAALKEKLTYTVPVAVFFHAFSPAAASQKIAPVTDADSTMAREDALCIEAMVQ